MRKLLMAAAVAGLLLGGASMTAGVGTARAAQAGTQAPDAATKTVTGKISAIGTDGKSFTLQVSGNSGDTNDNTMQFVLDPHAKVQGTVKIGTAVTVEYAMRGSQNTATSVTAQG
jgi:polyisoprenoid-binding protein YceI